MTDGLALMVQALVIFSALVLGVVVGWCLREERGDD